jgi:hypothetical protein
VDWLVSQGRRALISPTAVGQACAVKAKVTLRPTVREPVCLGVKPHLGHKTRFLLLSVVGLFMWGALSDERTGLSFTITAGPRQRCGCNSQLAGCSNCTALGRTQ